MAGKLVSVLVAVCLIGLVESGTSDWEMKYAKLLTQEPVSPVQTRDMLKELAVTKPEKFDRKLMDHVTIFLSLSDITTERCTRETMDKYDELISLNANLPIIVNYIRHFKEELVIFCKANVIEFKQYM